MREPLRKNALNYLTEKGQREDEIKLRQLQLEERKVKIEERRVAIEERKVAIDEKKVEIEYMERLQRIDYEKNRCEIELEEKKLTNKLLQSQQLFIDSILKK